MVKIKEELSSMGPKGVGRGRIALVDSKNAWFLTTTGAFSPVCPLRGVPMYDQVQRLRHEGINPTPTVILNMADHPELANHPSVTHRPYLKFFAGRLMVSGLGRRPHPIGAAFVSGPIKGETVEKDMIERLDLLCAKALEAVQSGLLRCLREGGIGGDDSSVELSFAAYVEGGNPSPELPTTTTIKEPKQRIEPPSVWVDIQTPDWEILGVNRSWEVLTGVAWDGLGDCPGLLSILVPADGSLASELRDDVLGLAARLPEGATISAVLSPRAGSGASLQFAVAIRRCEVGEVPPLPFPMHASDSALSKSISGPSVGMVGGEGEGEGGEGGEGTVVTVGTVNSSTGMWVVEIHARLQADTHRNGACLIEPYLSKFAKEDANSSTPNTFDDVVTAQQGDGSESTRSGQHVQQQQHRGGGGAPTMAPANGPPGAGGALAALLQGSGILPVPADRISGVPPRLASLEFGQRLGTGGDSIVYAGTLGDRPVAIKVIEIPGGASGVGLAEEWMAHYEALMAVDIPHPHVVKTYDWCRTEGIGGYQVWIIQELCDIGHLGNAIKWGLFKFEDPTAKGDGTDGGEGGGTFVPDYRAILETARDVASGMAFLHSMDEVHSDLCSNNVLLTSTIDGEDPLTNYRGFTAKIVDFGLSRLEGRGRSTHTHGTVSSCAPEVLMDGHITPRSDVYSYGVMLWELWAGKRAWQGKSEAQIVWSVSCQEEKLVMPQGTPEEYGALAQRCMATDPCERPDFEEVLDRLNFMLLGVGEVQPQQTPRLTARRDLNLLRPETGGGWGYAHAHALAWRYS